MADRDIRRATVGDAIAVSAFIRNQFRTRPDIKGADAELWTEEFTRDYFERRYCVLALEGGVVLGLTFYSTSGRCLIWGKDTPVGEATLFLPSGHPVSQVRILDCIQDFAYRDRWEPEGVDYLVASAPEGNAGIRYWIHFLGGSFTPGAVYWGIVGIPGMMRLVRGRLRGDG